MNNSNISIIFGSSKFTVDCGKIAISPLSNLKTKTRTKMTTLLYTFVYLASLYTPIPSSAQDFHKVFELGENNVLSLNLDAPYEVETWAGNTILTKTTVTFKNIPPNILEHFIKQGRYEIVENVTDTEIELSLKKLNRDPIRTKNGVAEETINIKIFVPENCTVNRLGKGSMAVQQTGE